MKGNIIVIKTETKIYRINKDEIFSVTVDSGIVGFVLENNEVINKSNSLKKTLEELTDFVRINNNTVVNVMYIREFCKKSRTLVLTNKEIHKVSVRKVKLINEMTLS